MVTAVEVQNNEKLKKSLKRITIIIFSSSDHNKMAPFRLTKHDFPVNFDLNDLPGRNEKVCVVAVIGKSPFKGKNCKAKFLDEIFQRSIFQGYFPDNKNDVSFSECKLECFYSPTERAIFLHLTGVFDAHNLTVACKDLANELSEKGYLHMFAGWKYKYAKAMLLLFSVCHIILIIHPGSSFDVSYIHLFRTLDSIRQKIQPHISDLLQGFPVSSGWLQAGRPCSPRALFIFQTCLLESKWEGGMDSSVRSKLRSQKLPPIKKLEHALEDQIYRLLRKSRIITNISGNSLFAIPANQEFVYVMAAEEGTSDVVGFLLNQLREQCLISSTKDVVTTGTKPKSFLQNLRPQTQFPNFTPNRHGSKDIDHSIKTFLWQHIELAHNKGFDDNVGRHPIPAYFELPTCVTWFEISSKIYKFLMEDPKETRVRNIFNSLQSLIDTDGRFSEGRCGKVLPLASAAYQENLPPHYTFDFHQSKLAQALHVFTMHARGPAFEQYAQQLREECESFWRNGHQLCEVRSLTGNHCINPLHRLPDNFEDDLTKHLPVMNHASQFKLVAACNCGRKQGNKDDPFDAKTGNYDFYNKMEEDCCGTLDRIDFPVFQPSIKDFRAARVLPKNSASMKRETPNRLERGSVSTPSMSLPLSLGHSECSDALQQEQSNASRLTPAAQQSLQEIPSEPPPAPPESSHKEKPLVRQPSTTEYLPGMLHLESPAGLLPKFPSWSLVCLGPSSLYSHNIGIQEQPGFILGTNFLLPWDMTIKLENKEKWPAISEVAGKKAHLLKAKKGNRDFSELTVKIFLGVEYECPRGHRFMCSGPDKVLKATGTGLVKDNASKISSNDMPLYFPCPCRSGKPLVAQLIRVHVVTPKAPVHVTLNPRVQPAPPPCPIFYPGNSEPVKLSQSAYWILRLPFVYVGEHTSYSPPKDMMMPIHGRLLKDLYGLSEVTVDK